MTWGDTLLYAPPARHDQVAAVLEPKAPPTVEDIDRQWRDYCVIEVMIRNPNVDSFVREKEAEVEGLWARIRTIAGQTDPEWALKLAKQAVAEREA